RVQVEQVLGEVALLDVDDVDVDALLGQHEASAMTPRVGRPREERHDRATVGDYRHARSLLGPCPSKEASRSRKYAVGRPQQAIIARTGSLRKDEAIGALFRRRPSRFPSSASTQSAERRAETRSREYRASAARAAS